MRIVQRLISDVCRGWGNGNKVCVTLLGISPVVVKSPGIRNAS